MVSRDAPDVNNVKLKLGNDTEYPLEGTLQFADISVDPTTASVILRTVFPNPQGVILPGMFVRAVVKEGIDEKAILIPQEAVSRDPKGNPVVLLVGAENKVEQRPITLDRAIGNQWLVASGLQAGDKVIVAGGQKVRPGVPVKDVPFVKGAQPAEGAGSAAAPASK